MRAPARGWTVVALFAAIAVLTASVTWTLHSSASGTSGPAWFGVDRSAIDRPGPKADIAGTVVEVVAIDMGGHQMMGRSVRGMGDTMLLRSNRVDVPAGVVTLRLYNGGAVTHELVVLPVADGQDVSERSVGQDGTIDESESLGEASQAGGSGSGDGIEPGTTGWVTIDLAPGRYEIACNIENHYAAGMHTLLVVS